jgi:LytS/YehU family sensor histidine kinase
MDMNTFHMDTVITITMEVIIMAIIITMAMAQPTSREQTPVPAIPTWVMSKKAVDTVQEPLPMVITVDTVIMVDTTTGARAMKANKLAELDIT